MAIVTEGIDAVDKQVATTLFNWSNMLYDQIGKGYPAMEFAKSVGKSVQGGDPMVIPLLYGLNNTGRWVGRYGAGEVRPQEGIGWAVYTWKQYLLTVVIDQTSIDLNSDSQTKILDILKATTTQAELSVQEDFSAQLHTGNASNALSLTGLNQHCAATGTTGAIDPSAKTWWAAKTVTASNIDKLEDDASNPSNLRLKWAELYVDCTRGGKRPTRILTTPLIHRSYWNVLNKGERFVDTSPGAPRGSYTNELKFIDADVLWDKDCAATKAYFINDSAFEFRYHPNGNFKLSDFVRPALQFIKIALLRFLGELTCNARNLNGTATCNVA